MTLTAISPRLATSTFSNIGPERLVDQSGTDGSVAGLVDQDEAAGAAIAAVWVEGEGSARAQAHAPDVIELELLRRGNALERVHVDHVLDRIHDRGGGARGVLEQISRAGAQRLLGHPADVGDELARDRGGLVGEADQLAARDVELVLEPQRERH